ncbi:MAG: hypothetical protein NVS2B16_25950 [Chloroflexota bacterium]
MEPGQIAIDVTSSLSPQNVQTGDVLYLYDPSEEAPSVVLIPDADHFQLLEHGRVTDRPADVDHRLAAGFFWRVVTTRPGDAILVVSPACRRLTPPCMRPDRALRVTIRP